jgi:uncharacterized protein (DUF1330 family)
MPVAYLMVEMHITDPESYKAYMASAPASLKAHGGEYLVRGGRHETLEGHWQPHRLALVRFPDYESAKTWYDGELYRISREHRAGTTAYFNMVLVEGVAAAT